MSTCLDKLSHSCGSSSGLQVFERDDGTVDGFCFSCKKYIRHPYGDSKDASDLPKPYIKTDAEIKAEISEIDGYPTVDIKTKKLRAETLTEYGVKVGLSEEDGKTPALLYYPYHKDGVLKGYKVKLLENKRIWSVGDIKGCDLFGWETATSQGARRLIITEGEDDAISLRRTLKRLTKNKEYEDYVAVVSIPTGVHNAKDVILRNLEKINKYFDEVALCFDMDEPGRTAVDEICAVCPTFGSIDLPSKDANQCVLDGKEKALYNATYKPERPKNTRLVFGDDIAMKAMVPPTYGQLSWPWNHIQDATRGIRYGETIYLGAGVKMGKSELLNALAAHFMRVHDIKVFMAKPEEVNNHTYKLLAGKMVGRIFHDPKIPFDEEAYLKAVDMLAGKVSMVDLYQHIGWESLKADIIASAAWGAKAIFIDPITNLTDGMSPGDANVKLEEISKDLSVMAKDLNIVIFIFCHLKAHDGSIGKEARERQYRDNKFIGLGNCPHEMGGDIFSNQFAGSRSMMRKCNMMVGFEGNKDPDLPDEVRNVRSLKILEEREFGANGNYPIYWNANSSIFSEC